jgi:yecA family protein
MAMPAASPPPGVIGRSFALLDQAEREKIAGVLRPLAWLDGLVTAVILAPEENDDWTDHIWIDEGGPEALGLAQLDEVATVVEDHFLHVADMLYDDPEAYRPYLSGAADQAEAAAQWAAGFRFGIRLRPEPWAPLIEDDDSRSLLAAIFSLERDEDLPEAARADSPFRDMPADRRQHMRRTALEMLPSIVLALHDYSLDLGDDDLDAGDAREP